MRDTPLLSRLFPTIAALGAALVPQVCSAVKIMPPKADVGHVPVGAIAEASLRIYWGNHEVTTTDPEITLPEWVSLKSTTTGLHERQMLDDYTELVLKFDTSVAAMHDGEIQVRYGLQKAAVPVAVSVTAPKPGRPSVLVAGSPFCVFSTDKDTDFDAWRELVKSSELNVNYLHVFHNGPTFPGLDLARFDVIVLHAAGLSWVAENEVQALQTFVAEGGRLVLAANAFLQGTVDKANSLTAPHGILMFDTELRTGDATYQTPVADDDGIRKHPLTENVNKPTFFRGSPLVVTAPNAELLAVAGMSDGYVARARFGRGEFVVIGHSLICSWVQDTSDNRTFMKNLLTLPVE